MTLEEAKGITPGQTVYQIGAYNADRTPRRWRVNGKVKLWKRDTGRIRIPIKHGMYTYDYITEDSLHLLAINEEEAYI